MKRPHKHPSRRGAAGDSAAQRQAVCASICGQGFLPQGLNTNMFFPPRVGQLVSVRALAGDCAPAPLRQGCGPWRPAKRGGWLQRPWLLQRTTTQTSGHESGSCARLQLLRHGAGASSEEADELGGLWVPNGIDQKTRTDGRFASWRTEPCAYQQVSPPSTARATARLLALRPQQRRAVCRTCHELLGR